ncbi:acyltransferase [Candidatus Magnetomonas plexicatena]|uniref:acyltransferase n=1 Tax=Candidatus Magnetomonas plexicatena TaxID=2552947 RepID=UPI0011043E38|nr:transferase [Nitrospirales bacterium LBB_01]
MISSTAIIYPNVILGENCTIEDFVIIGVVPTGYDGEPLETVIGDNAVIRSHTVIYAGNTIGNNFQTGNKANIRELNLIGHNVSIGTLTVVEHHTAIGSGVRIHSQSFIPEFTIIENGAWIGPNVVLTNSKYPNSPGAKESLTNVCVREGAVVGANVTILPGVVVGEKALIGAGSVVVKHVPDRAVVVGNPAKAVKSIDELPYRA